MSGNEITILIVLITFFGGYMAGWHSGREEMRKEKALRRAKKFHTYERDRE